MEFRRAPASATERRAHWQDVVAAGKASNLSVREFCRQRGIHPSHFYYWRQRLARESAAAIQPSAKRKPESRFALVRAEPAPAAVSATHDGALELILESGWRLHIRPGVDAATLRTVLSALAPEA
jgi:transposase-like protein